MFTANSTLKRTGLRAFRDAQRKTSRSARSIVKVGKKLEIGCVPFQRCKHREKIIALIMTYNIIAHSSKNKIITRNWYSLYFCIAIKVFVCCLSLFLSFLYIYIYICMLYYNLTMLAGACAKI